MHDSEPADQLSKEGRGDGACASCHAEQARAGSAHTHHAPDSPGSRCYSCHMPYTSYALFKGIRSHRVDSPSVQNELLTGRPNACNGCHADRSLGFAAARLEEWYGIAAPELGEDERRTSATLRALYQGDAAERALAAFALGQPETRRAASSHFQAPHLASLLDDPYSAVRLVAWKSLRELPGFAGFDYDFPLRASRGRTRCGKRSSAPPLVPASNGRKNSCFVPTVRSMRLGSSPCSALATSAPSRSPNDRGNT